MTELLHAWAIAPAAIGACCLAADRGRARWPDAVASAIMLIAMLDAALARLVAPVYWTVLLLASAMAFAAWQRPRRAAGSRAGSTPGPMTVHTGLGLVGMAALQLAMAPQPAVTIAATAHAHGAVGGGSLLSVLLVGGAAAYAALSALLVLRAHRRLDRAQLICMGASVLIMAVGAVL